MPTPKQQQQQRSLEEQAFLSRAGGFRANAGVTPEKKRAWGAKGLRVVITKRADPDGQLQRSDPREFERRYTLELKAHMAELAASSAAAKAERRMVKLIKRQLLFVFAACPECNAELGYAVPTGVKQELCVPHWLAEKAARFGAVLDDAQAKIAS